MTRSTPSGVFVNVEHPTEEEPRPAVRDGVCEFFDFYE